MIEQGAFESLQNLKRVAPYVPGKPTTITIELGAVEHADHFRGRHGVEIVDPLTVVSRGRDWMAAWNQIWDWTI
jgi:D-aminopeptidase